MSEHTEQVKDTTIVHPLFPDGTYENIKEHYVFLDWFILPGTLLVIFVLLKAFIYHPDEKRKDQ